MVEVWLLTVVGGGVASLAVWVIKNEVSSLVTDSDIDPAETPTTADVEEVHDMAQRAIKQSADAKETAENARSEIQQLSNLLVESTNDVDEPLLVRMQDRLESIESELQQQSRVEVERAWNMSRIAKALEEMDGVNTDEMDMDELYSKLPMED